MTKLINVSNDIAKKLDWIKRINPKLSYSDVIHILYRDFNHNDTNKIIILEAFEKLEANLPSYYKGILHTTRQILIKIIDLDDSSKEIAKEGLMKFLTDLNELKKQE